MGKLQSPWGPGSTGTRRESALSVHCWPAQARNQRPHKSLKQLPKTRGGLHTTAWSRSFCSLLKCSMSDYYRCTGGFQEANFRGEIDPRLAQHSDRHPVAGVGGGGGSCGLRGTPAVSILRDLILKGSTNSGPSTCTAGSPRRSPHRAPLLCHLFRPQPGLQSRQTLGAAPWHPGPAPHSCGQTMGSTALESEARRGGTDTPELPAACKACQVQGASRAPSAKGVGKTAATGPQPAIVRAGSLPSGTWIHPSTQIQGRTRPY